MTTTPATGLTPQGYPKTLAEPPYEELKKLSENGVTEVLIYPKRWNDKGKVMTLKSQMCTVGDILTDGLATQLREEYGGGSYLIHVRDINDPATDICQRFMINIVGAQRTPLSYATGGGLPAGGGGVPSQPQMVAGFRYGEMNGGGAVRPQEIATYTSDAIAMQTAQELREELKQARKDATNREKQMQQKIDQLAAEARTQREEAERRASEMRDNMLRAEIASLKEKFAQPVKPAFDLTALIAGIGAIVPIFTALITTGKDRQQLALDAQKHSSEQQFQMLMSMLKKPEGKDPGVEMLMTLLPKLLEARDPSKQADVLTAMAESQMSSLHMTAQIMRELAPESDHPVMALAREVIGGVMHVVEATQQQQAQQGQTAPQLQGQPQPAQVVAGAPPNAVATQQAQSGRQPRPAARPAAAAPRNARELAQAIVADPQWPKDMQSRVWINILTTLHGEQAPDDIGGEIGKMMEGLQQIDELAAVFLPMFEDDGPAPSTLVRPYFDMLPIAQPTHRVRYEAILRALDQSYDVETPVPLEVPPPLSTPPDDASAMNGNGHADEHDADNEVEHLEASEDVHEKV